MGSPLQRLPGPRELATLAHQYAADPTQWPVLPEFNPLERWYARIVVAPDHEAWLLSWLPGQGTELHDHGGAAGAFHVVTGCLTEETPTRGPRVRLAAKRYRAGDTRVFGARHVHRVRNESGAPAVSLHVYSPALATMTRYHIEAGALRVSTVERAGADW